MIRKKHKSKWLNFARKSILGPSLVASILAAAGMNAQPVDGVDDRIKAVTDTIESNSVCSELPAFYWEIGNGGAALGSGFHGSAAGNAEAINTFKNTPIKIASAGKWIFAAYAVEILDGILNDSADVRFLNFTSPFVTFQPETPCKEATWSKPPETIQACNDRLNNIETTAAGDNGGPYGFFYGPGHMEWRADPRYGNTVALGLAGDVSQLGARIGETLGLNSLSYDNVNVAAAARLSPADYILFLRKLLSGELKLGSRLGEHSVCTLEETSRYGLKCKYASDRPAAGGLVWEGYLNPRYSLGHWVEDPDEYFGDGAYSSVGGYGLYPWIDKDRATYGIIAFESQYQTVYKKSARCGRMLRAAWARKIVQRESDYAATEKRPVTCNAIFKKNCPGVIPDA